MMLVSERDTIAGLKIEYLLFFNSNHYIKTDSSYLELAESETEENVSPVILDYEV